jgi:hypothetical protein
VLGGNSYTNNKLEREDRMDGRTEAAHLRNASKSII